MRFFVGSYAQAEQAGIYCSRLDTDKTYLEPELARAGSLNPSFLACSPDNQWLYAVNEAIEEEGRIVAFRILGNGRLNLINSQPTGGAAPCHVSLSMQHRLLVVSNYLGSSLSVHRLQDDGGIAPHHQIIMHSGSSIHPTRQQSAHPHSAVFDEDESHIFVPDLGCDALFVYAIHHEKLELEHKYSLPAGSGPRHLTLHPSGYWLYLVNELVNTVTVFQREVHGLRAIQTVSTLPDGYVGDSTAADIHISSDGHFVYASNRGHDSLVIYNVQPNGVLDQGRHVFTGGKTPRNFALSPDDNHLLIANQDSNLVCLFRRNNESGELQLTESRLLAPQASCIIFENLIHP